MCCLCNKKGWLNCGKMKAACTGSSPAPGWVSASDARSGSGLGGNANYFTFCSLGAGLEKKNKVWVRLWLGKPHLQLLTDLKKKNELY